VGNQSITCWNDLVAKGVNAPAEPFQPVERSGRAGKLRMLNEELDCKIVAPLRPGGIGDLANFKDKVSDKERVKVVKKRSSDPL
jgi:hypothetical protein